MLKIQRLMEEKVLNLASTMPRRRTPKSAKGVQRPHKSKKSDATIKKWKTAGDVPLDEVDQCGFSARYPETPF